MTPWPDDVFDCAVRLARSLGYQEIDISEHKGRVYVFCAEQSSDYTEKISELYNKPVRPLWAIFDGDWRELDPRDPTVWSALIGPHDVNIVSSHVDILTYTADWFARSRNGTAAKGKTIGLAVCEAYNNLKGHPRSGK